MTDRGGRPIVAVPPPEPPGSPPDPRNRPDNQTLPRSMHERGDDNDERASGP